MKNDVLQRAWFVGGRILMNRVVFVRCRMVFHWLAEMCCGFPVFRRKMINTGRNKFISCLFLLKLSNYQIIFAFSLMFDVEESSFPKMGYCKLRLTSPRRTQLLKDF